MTETKMIVEVYSWFQEEREDYKSNFVSCTKEQLIQYHTSLGRNIRNHFKLWENDWEPEYKMHDTVQYDDSPNHPDAISMRIIEAVWEKAKEDYTWIK